MSSTIQIKHEQKLLFVLILMFYFCMFDNFNINMELVFLKILNNNYYLLPSIKDNLKNKIKSFTQPNFLQFYDCNKYIFKNKKKTIS